MSDRRRYITDEARQKHLDEQRRYALKYPEKVLEQQRRARQKRGAYSVTAKRQREKFPEKMRARATVFRALRAGKLLRPDHCSGCFRACKPHAHHADYDKPLDVSWLCRACHLKEHGLEQRVIRTGDSLP